MDTIRWLARYIRPYSTSWTVGSLLTIVVALLNMVQPYISGLIVDFVINERRVDLLIPLLLTMIGSVLIRTFFRYRYQVRFEAISQDVLFQIRGDLYRKLQELDFFFL